MKAILRHYIVNTISLYIISSFSSGLVFEFGMTTLLLTGLGLTLASLVVKPVINILMLPLNLITFGLFRWVSSAIVLYLVTLVVRGFDISHFGFVGYTSAWIDLPAVALSGFLAIVVFSFLHSIISSFIYWLIK